MGQPCLGLPALDMEVITSLPSLSGLRRVRRVSVAAPKIQWS